MLSRLSARFLNLAGTRAAPACKTAASMAGVRRAMWTGVVEGGVADNAQAADVEDDAASERGSRSGWLG